MNEIKVSVSYDKPTTSKFDALMAEYEAAKRRADETVAYYKPLADVAEEAKFNAIIEQLETIKKYANKLCEFSENKQVTIRAYISADERGGSTGCYFSVFCHSNGNYCIRWDGMDFTAEAVKKYPDDFTASYSERYNILGHWDKWKVYEYLEKDALRQLQGYIGSQNKRAEKQINRLNNITKEGI